MTKPIRNSSYLIFIAILALSACNTLSTTYSVPYVQGLSSTFAVQTMVANPNLIFLVQTATPTSPSYTPTATLAPSALPSEPPTNTSPLPTETPFPSLTPIDPLLGSIGVDLTTGECINAAEFVEDVTIPDDTLIKPGKGFTKIWRLRNTGSCTWTPEYGLVFVAGDQMEGMSPKKLEITVEPGHTIDLALDLVAPPDMNYYQGNWMLQDEFGENFGTGSDANGPFWVSIKVYVKGWTDIFGGGGGGGNGGRIPAGCGGGG